MSESLENTPVSASSEPVSAPVSSGSSVGGGSSASAPVETPLSAGPFGDSAPSSAVSTPSSPANGNGSAVPATGAGNVPVTGEAVADSGAPAVDPWVQQLQDMGFQGITTPQEAQRRVVEAIQLRNQQLAAAQQQAQQYEQYARAYAQQQQDPRWLAFQQQQMQSPQAPEAPQGHPWWKAPQVDLTLLEQYREEQVDPVTGQKKLAWKADAPLEYKQAAEQYTRHLKQWQEDLVTRPHEVLPQIIQTEVMPLIEQAFAQREQQMRTQSFVQEVNEKNADWMYAKDPVTQQFLVDHQGQRVLSGDGQHVGAYISQATQLGIQDPQARWQFATMAYERDLLRHSHAQRQQAQGAVATHEQQKLQHLQAAAAQAVPNRGGSTMPNTPPVQPSRRLSAGQALMAQFAASGVEPFNPVG